MNVLIVGGGGREHALAWKIKQSPLCGKLYCAPGNAGTAQIAENVPIKAADIEKLAAFAQENAVDFTVVGPDDPLAAGIVDLFEERGLKIFGPNRAAARIESSKAFSKALMKKYGIPTADYRAFAEFSEAKSYLESAAYPLVVKADGLALGKGVSVCFTPREALNAAGDCMLAGVFGGAGSTIVVEEFLTGPEISFFALCDGEHLVPLAGARDYKRALDGDKGLNTGGMGAVSPCPYYSAELHAYVTEHIALPTVRAMKSEGCPFKGLLYFGLMNTPDGVKVLEYNARFGDPETQAVVPLIAEDLLPFLVASADGTLGGMAFKPGGEAAVCVTLASDGYPAKYETGFEVTGLDGFPERTVVFHAGTRLEDGRVITSGGRVLSVVGCGGDYETARQNAYAAAEAVRFQNKYFRTEIGK